MSGRGPGLAGSVSGGTGAREQRAERSLRERDQGDDGISMPPVGEGDLSGGLAVRWRAEAASDLGVVASMAGRRCQSKRLEPLARVPDHVSGLDLRDRGARSRSLGGQGTASSEIRARTTAWLPTVCGGGPPSADRASRRIAITAARVRARSPSSAAVARLLSPMARNDALAAAKRSLGRAACSTICQRAGMSPGASTQ